MTEHVVSFPEGQPAIFCPLCQLFHEFHWGPGLNVNGQSWKWNQDLNKPSFFPAIVTKVANPITNLVYICYAYVQDGKITYTDKTTHQGKGQTMELQAI